MYICIYTDRPSKVPVRSDKTVYLLHKMEMVTPGAGVRHELGGDIADHELQGAIAVHATCYEKSTKLLALRNANVCYDQKYYSASRRTLTKPMMFLSKSILKQELVLLAYISIHSNREFILPNILQGMGIFTVVIGL